MSGPLVMLEDWVVDTLIALERHREEHPQYHAEYYPDYVMRKAETCGCEPLDHVPAHIRAAIQAVSDDRMNREANTSP